MSILIFILAAYPSAHQIGELKGTAKAGQTEFQEEVRSVNPVVEFRIPLDMEGEIRYFCLPHCFVDEVAIIFIEPDPCPADVDDDGSVGFIDLLSLLDGWGLCGCCREDLDASGAVNFADLLLLLAAWGPCA